MQLALDAMGGDHAPGPIVAGALQAVAADPELRVTLVGDREQVESCLEETSDFEGIRDRVDIFHCSQVVGMHESPVEALRFKPDNSISRCWELLSQEKVNAVVSAGNTGAMVAGGMLRRLFLKHVRRPGIAAVLPTLRGQCILLDVGANISPKPLHLYHYGVMGDIYAKQIFKCEKPKIGLMNVGSEEQKGHDLAKETHALFNTSILKEQFIGNIEGRDIFQGVADVVVTDGFVGNVVLKTCEGMFEFSMKLVGGALHQALDGERDKALGAIHELVRKHEYHEQGGAPLLGIAGICIICHGSSNDRAIKNALGMAANYARVKLNAKIVEELESKPLHVIQES